MREIKFRAWHKFEKKMYKYLYPFEWGQWDWSSEKSCALLDAWKNNGQHAGQLREEDFDVCIFMPFTGLKDKKGKEIYEGDIVKTTESPDEILWQVKWSEDKWIIEELECARILNFHIEWKNLEVVGNIYEK